MIEAHLESYLDRRVIERGGETRKVEWPGRRGAPDRLVLMPRSGFHYLVELKRPKGGKLEPHQEREHERLRAAGFQVLVLASRAAIDRAFP